MNFLLHRHLAHRFFQSAAAGIGAMLPDLWRMADKRVRPALNQHDAWRALGDTDDVTRDVMRGIEHHLEADLWFHEHDVFVSGERATAAALREAKTTAKKLVLFAHPLWEMCLDGALVRTLGAETVRSEVALGFEKAFDAAHAALVAHHFALVDESEEYKSETQYRMRWFADELSAGPWIAGYAKPEGLVRALTGMRRRFSLPPFLEDERERLITAVAGLATLADGALQTILATR
ncbi:MAG: hypothetical protein IPK82_37900 [Polyangiaceae bacterium]|nr:hypothetical protein [Polyangiaceae bacterium]